MPRKVPDAPDPVPAPVVEPPAPVASPPPVASGPDNPAAPADSSQAGAPGLTTLSEPVRSKIGRPPGSKTRKRNPVIAGLLNPPGGTPGVAPGTVGAPIVRTPFHELPNSEKDEVAATFDLMASSTFRLIALFRGPHWNLTDAEREAMRKPGAKVLYKYAPFLAEYGDIIVLGQVLITCCATRAMMDRAIALQKKSPPPAPPENSGGTLVASG